VKQSSEAAHAGAATDEASNLAGSRDERRPRAPAASAASAANGAPDKAPPQARRRSTDPQDLAKTGDPAAADR
jgi:hypothetical protein